MGVCGCVCVCACARLGVRVWVHAIVCALSCVLVIKYMGDEYIYIYIYISIDIFKLTETGFFRGLPWDANSSKLRNNINELVSRGI